MQVPLVFKEQADKSILLFIFIKPNARCNKVLDTITLSDKSYLQVAIVKEAIDNKANNELVSFIAKSLDIAPSNISVKQGKKSRYKTLLVKEAPYDNILLWIKGDKVG